MIVPPDQLVIYCIYKHYDVYYVVERHSTKTTFIYTLNRPFSHVLRHTSVKLGMLFYAHTTNQMVIYTISYELYPVYTPPHRKKITFIRVSSYSPSVQCVSVLRIGSDLPVGMVKGCAWMGYGTVLYRFIKFSPRPQP